MDFATTWSNLDIENKKDSLKDFINNPHTFSKYDYLDIIKAPKNWGVYASNGPNFKYAVFGRDSIVVAEDLINSQKQLVHDIILVLAKLQGVNNNDDSEEEPGKIHHEFRAKEYDGIKIPDYSLGVMSNLQKLWGEEGTEEMIYYGGYDATPLFVRLVCAYVKKYGKSILDENYTNRNNDPTTVMECLKRALGWITYKFNESQTGLLEYKRINPHGIENQAWKDSRTGYLRRDGSLPDFNKGIASIEIQGYAYDALIGGAELFAESKEESSYWASLAHELALKVVDWFWMDDVNFFAQALYLDDNENRVLIDTLTSNGALILNSYLLNEIPESKRIDIVSKIADMISSPEFLTKAGIRSRALRHENIPGFIDYHGTYTVWHKESNEIAKGLRKFNFHELASLIEDRIVNTILSAGEFCEFHYVDSDDTVWYDRNEAVHYFSHRSPGGNLPIPEPGQAWTISALFRICLDSKNDQFALQNHHDHLKATNLN